MPDATTSPTPPLTIAQAASQLHVSERTLRRALRGPDLQARLQATTRQVAGRTRQVSLIDAELLALLSQRFYSKDNPKRATGRPAGKARGNQQAKQQAQQTATLPDRAAEPPEVPAVAYQRIIAEQAARIADLQAALDSERENARRHAEAAARAQILLGTTNATPPRPSLWQRLFRRGKSDKHP